MKTCLKFSYPSDFCIICSYFYYGEKVNIFDLFFKPNEYIEDIQMFGVNMTFISSSEVKKCIFHSCLIWIFFLLYTSHSTGDANLAFARGSLTSSFVPWQ